MGKHVAGAETVGASHGRNALDDPLGWKGLAPEPSASTINSMKPSVSSLTNSTVDSSSSRRSATEHQAPTPTTRKNRYQLPKLPEGYV